MRLFSRNKKSQSEPPKLRPAPAAAAPAVAKSAKPPVAKKPGATSVPSRSPAGNVAPAQKQSPKPVVKIISNKDDIPSFERILGATDQVNIRPSLKNLYLPLLLSQNEKKALLVCSEETHKAGVVDQAKLDLISQIKKSGISDVKSVLVVSSLIEILRARAEDGELTLSAREATEMEAAYDALLHDAILQGASDIHIEVRRDNSYVKYRVHGILSQRHEWGTQHARKFCQVAYMSLADQDSKDVVFKPDRSQDGVIDRNINGERVRTRLATTRAFPDGFDMVLRILRLGNTDENLTLEKLGYNAQQRRSLSLAINRPSGVVVIAGTTGSGKSTTLKTVLQGIVVETRGQEKIISVEDPPEYRMRGVTQSPVQSAQAKDGKNPFAAAIKAAMRLDPDKLMVGEVRDELTAQLLVQMTQSGHLAFTTVHAASAFGILPRFRSLSIPNDVLGSSDFLVALMYQCLVGTLCESCRIPLATYQKLHRDPKSIELYGRISRGLPKSSWGNVFFRNDDGCSGCHRGLHGRTVVAQLVLPTIQMKELIAEGKDMLAQRSYIESGGATLLDHGIEKVVTGLCSPIDIEKECGQLDNREYEKSLAGRGSDREATPIAGELPELEIQDETLQGMKSGLLSSPQLARPDNVKTMRSTRDSESSGGEQ